MCGISGIIDLDLRPIQSIEKKLIAQSQLISHRGPDGIGIWQSDNKSVGFSHSRLAVIDLSTKGNQPMEGIDKNIITFNGEIYNYLELNKSLDAYWTFKSETDTECILASYHKLGEKCLGNLRGMFSFALWDQKRQKLFCARDRFGIKPFYYTIIDGIFYFASEAKALVPFLKKIETNKHALAEYLTFQYSIGEKTLFEGIYQLLPGHALTVNNGNLNIWRYWDISYDIDYSHNSKYFEEKLRDLVDDTISLHLRSDVEIGSYVSGGIDSSLMYKLASQYTGEETKAFHGMFSKYPGYDESEYAKAIVSREKNLHITDITSGDFVKNIEDVIYHLDFPIAGPGSFPQFMVSKLASENVKVVFGGQGGDEIFGGYARYLIAYFEQCIKAAINGSYKDGNFVVTIESIIPNLGILKEYKPLIKQFWSAGLFEEMDKRYFSLIDRSSDMKDEINWHELDTQQVFRDFSTIFNNPSNVKKEAYFDKMTHFDFKCLLPALLQVEDRMSMAHGLESRVPLLDHPLVEFVATIPADIKFQGGNMKHLLKKVYAGVLPERIIKRRDKMGFPVPLKNWFEGDIKEYITDLLSSKDFESRFFVNKKSIFNGVGQEHSFSRKYWALLSLEIWHKRFHDQASQWKKIVA